MSRAIKLTDEINEYLKQYYPEEQFPNLYDAAKTLLEITKDSEDDEDEDDGEWEEEDEYVSEGSDNEEPAPQMSEIDKVLQSEERYLQMERARQIAEIKLQNLERELKKEEEDVSDGSDHEKQVQAIIQEIERRIAERVL